MHSRRIGAFLIGGWLIGTVLMWFVTSQSLANVDRVLNNPTPAIASDMEQVGPGLMRSLSRHQAIHFNRYLTEVWEYLQLGIVGALFTAATFTSARSRVVVPAVLVLLVLVSVEGFVITPSIGKLQEATEQTSAPMDVQKDLIAALIYRRLLEIAKLICGVLISVRLLWDWHSLAETARARHRHKGKRHEGYTGG